jgi:hypothetical protein
MAVPPANLDLALLSLDTTEPMFCAGDDASLSLAELIADFEID